MQSPYSALKFHEDNGKLQLTFGSVTRSPMDWNLEVERSVLEVANRATKPIWICSSGGIDSELICDLMLRAKVPFKVLTVQHKSGSNSGDVKWAFDWCKVNGVEQRIVSFDPVSFFSNYIPEKLKAGYYSPCPFRFFQLFLLEQIERLDGFGIIGVGEQRYFYNQSADEAYLDLDSGLYWVQEFAGDRHVPFFFYGTPEMMAAYMESPFVKAALEFPKSLAHKENIFLLKRIVYQAYYPHLKSREKLDGWENVALAFAVARSRLQAQANGRTQYFEVLASELTKQLHPKLKKST